MTRLQILKNFNYFIVPRLHAWQLNLLIFSAIRSILINEAQYFRYKTAALYYIILYSPIILYNIIIIYVWRRLSKKTIIKLNTYSNTMKKKSSYF